MVYSSYVDVCNFHLSLQFSDQFAIFISVCNSHVMTPALTYDGTLDGFYVTRLELINSTSVMVLPVEDKDKIELSKIDYCWYIAVDTLSTLGSLFSSIPPYHVVRHSGT